MPSRYSVQVHQGTKAAASVSGSYSSSSGNSTPRTVSSGTHREHGATKHTSQVTRSGNTLVIDHGKTDFEPGVSSPRYGGVYQ